MAYRADRITTDGFNVPTGGINQPAFGFFCGVAGTVVVVTAKGTTLSFVCPAGARVDIAISSFVSAPASGCIAFGPT